MTDEEREMLEFMWENFLPLMEDVEEALDHLRLLNRTTEQLGERVRRLEAERGPTLH